MAAGGPGDHPLTDVIDFKTDHYGKEAGDLMRELNTLISTPELEQFWSDEIGLYCEPDIAVEKAKRKIAEAKKQIS